MKHSSIQSISDSKAPVSNTGANTEKPQQHRLSDDLTVLVDWIQGTIWLDSYAAVEALIEAVMKLLDDEAVWDWQSGHFMGKQWNHRGHSLKGCQWWFTSPGEGGQKVHLCLSLPGGVVSQIPIRKLWEFSKTVLLFLGFKATRFDIAVDDYAKRITADDIESALTCGNFGIFRTWKPGHSYDKYGKKIGFTYYLGSNGCDSFARIYDKDTESKGRIRSHRFEAQFKKKKADFVWKEWLSIPAELFNELSPQFLSGTALGLAEFVNRISRNGRRIRELSECQRLLWWDVFVKEVGSHIRHSVPREDTTLERAMQWAEKQVFGTLAAIQKAVGLIEFRRWIDEGLAQKAANFTKQQMAKVAQWSKGKSDVNQRTNGAIDVIDEDGTQWIWVWVQNTLHPSMSDWYRARKLSSNATSVKVRLSGEKSRSIPRRMCHFGDEKPTWVPDRITAMVQQWSVNADIV